MCRETGPSPNHCSLRAGWDAAGGLGVGGLSHHLTGKRLVALYDDAHDAVKFHETSRIGGHSCMGDFGRPPVDQGIHEWGPEPGWNTNWASPWHEIVYRWNNKVQVLSDYAGLKPWSVTCVVAVWKFASYVATLPSERWARRIPRGPFVQKFLDRRSFAQMTLFYRPSPWKTISPWKMFRENLSPYTLHCWQNVLAVKMLHLAVKRAFGREKGIWPWKG